MNRIPSRLIFLSLAMSSSLTANIINVPADYSTIQTALMAADSSDTVLVQPGTYPENIFWPDVNGIKLISAGDTSDTIIDGDSSGSVIHMNPLTATIDSTTEIRGFKITNGGNIANGGGMFVSNASPVLTRLWVTDNTASSDGGGLYIYASNATLTDVTVSGNTASSGGGLYISGGSPNLTNVTVTGNTAGSSGGGLYISGGSPTLTGVTVSGNTTSNGGGGGLYISNSDPALTDVTVTGNTASYSGDGGGGGGLYIYHGSPTLTDVTVTGNTVTNAGGGGGGGLYIFGGSPTLTNVTVSGNAAPSGGGILIHIGSATLTNVTISTNVAYSNGGGLWFSEGNLILTNVTVVDNISLGGGGGLFLSGSAMLNQVRVVNNMASGNGGGLIIASDYYGRPTLVDMDVSNNTSNNKGGGLYISSGIPTLTRVTVSRNLGAGLYFRSGSATLVNVTITGNTSGIYVESGTPTIVGTNIAYHGVGLYNADNTNIVDADSIWWGDSSGPYHPIQNTIGLGDSTNAFVNVTPFLTEPNTAAPPIPVQNLTVTNKGDDFIDLTWDASPIGDLAGYRIYFDTDSSGFPYADTVDVGNSTSVTLSNLEPGLSYFIAAICYDTDGNESWYSEEVSTGASLSVSRKYGIPFEYALHPGYPNPFNPSITLPFDLPKGGPISLMIYDLMGREVIRLAYGDMTAGYHHAVWNGKGADGRAKPTGIYIARLVSPGYSKSIKMLLLK